MTITSTAPSSSASSTGWRNWGTPKGQRLLAATAGTLAVCFLLFATPNWRRNRRLLAAFLFIFIFVGGVAFVGCGGGSATTTPPPPPPNPGTTPGSYVFTVNGALNANGIGQAKAMVTVTIQ